ncbi:hypothetical protein Taro_007929 [Colocasia esculenta]|uniref:Transcription factor CBF/NF-Y/archaeal histone domain-containing protein n=1 Tax=Colocasia esculenta TaxID=4460 RepID=A0A843U0Z8_COLES|nr:hypothetical protein [Colocasia esculenta]
MERSGGCPNYRRLLKTTSAGTPQPEPVRIAPRPAASTGNNGAPFTATAAAGNRDTSNNNNGSGVGTGLNFNGRNGGVDNNNNGAGNPQGVGEGTVVREQDRFMPIANVIRIMRRVLPTHAKIADDAKETIQECVSEYISFITSEANERCQQEQRKTITAEDLLWAMSKLGFDDYVEPLTLYLQRYRDLEGDHRSSLRGEPLLTPLKRAASDSGLYGPPAPAYHAVPQEHQNHQPIPPHHYFYAPQPLPHPPPHLPTPVFFPPGAAGSGSSSAATAGGGLMPVSYYREAGGSLQAGSSSQAQHPSAGFDPYAPYNRPV